MMDVVKAYLSGPYDTMIYIKVLDNLPGHPLINTLRIACIQIHKSIQSLNHLGREMNDTHLFLTTID